MTRDHRQLLDKEGDLMSFSKLAEDARDYRRTQRCTRQAIQQQLHRHADLIYHTCHEKPPRWEAIVATHLAMMRTLLHRDA